MIGIADLTASWAAFETINRVKVTVQVAHEVQAGEWALVLRAEAWGQNTVTREAERLASESVRCSALEWSHLDTALFRLLYALDSALAFKELGGRPRTAKP